MLEARELSRSYGGAVALAPTSLQIQPGVTAVLGRNGAGKSTLLRLLATVEQPDSGVLLHEDRPLSHRPTPATRSYRRGLGWLPQAFDYPPRSSVVDFVRYVGWLKEIPRRALARSVDEALERVQLTDRRLDPLGSLSGGMLRRAGLAQALVNEPEVVLLDEPTAGLDPEQRDELAAVVSTIGPQTAVVWSTHILEDVAAAAGRVLVLDHGNVQFDGPVAELVGGEAVTTEALRAAFARLTRDAS